MYIRAIMGYIGAVMRHIGAILKVHWRCYEVHWCYYEAQNLPVARSVDTSQSAILWQMHVAAFLKGLALNLSGFEFQFRFGKPLTINCLTLS